MRQSLVILFLCNIGMGMSRTCPEHSLIMQDSARIWCIWFITEEFATSGLIQKCADDGGWVFAIEDSVVESYLEEVLAPILRNDRISDILINYYTPTGATFEGVPQTYNNWPRGIQQDDHECVKTTIGPVDFYWDTVPCSLPMFGICYRAFDCPAESMLVLNNTQCFWTTNNLTDAQGGQDNCLADGGTLAVISNSDINDELIANHLSTIIAANVEDGEEKDLWIGVTDQDMEGVFTTWNTEPVTFLNWETGQPNDDRTAIVQDCVKIKVNNNLQWHDMPCEDQRIALCSKDLAEDELTDMPPTPMSTNEIPGISDMTSPSTTRLPSTPGVINVSQMKLSIMWSLFILVSEKMVPDPTIHNSDVIYYLPGIIECALKCQEAINCESFTFCLVTDEITGGCHLYRSVIDLDLVYKTESRYFRKDGNM